MGLITADFPGESPSQDKLVEWLEKSHNELSSKYICGLTGRTPSFPEYNLTDMTLGHLQPLTASADQTVRGSITQMDVESRAAKIAEKVADNTMKSQKLCDV